jgi:hypothetical protein
LRYFIIIGFILVLFPSAYAQSCQYPICVIEAGDGQELQNAGSNYPIKVQIEPNQEFHVQIFDPQNALAVDKTIISDEKGFASIMYHIPEDAKNGYYKIQLSATDENGLSYYGLIFRIGNISSDLPRYLFPSTDVRQDRKWGAYEIDKPITVYARIGYGGNATFKQYLPNTPVSVTLYDPSSQIIDQKTVISTGDDAGISYIFTPAKYGPYKILLEAQYNGFKDKQILTISVKPSAEHIIKAEGKEFSVIVDKPGDFDIKNVEFSQQEKRLSIEFEPPTIFGVLDVEIPYELLDNLTVFANDKEINLRSGLSGGTYNDYTFAALRIPVDNTVTKVDIYGASAIPEFGPISSLILAVSLISIIVMFTTKFRKNL